MNEIVLLQSAQADILEIIGRHGDSYYGKIDRVLEWIRRMPNAAPIYHGVFRRKLVEGTPYGIFHSVVGSRLMVSFVMDLRQNPATIAKRIQTRR